MNGETNSLSADGLRETTGERPFGAAEALTEAARCLYCYDAPCVMGCPAGVDVPEFIRSLRTGAWRAAARLLIKANPLGESCGCVCPTVVLCEGECVLPRIDGQAPVAIHRLQRFILRWARENQVEVVSSAPPSGKSVALIGAGPAGLACAFELRRFGHHAVVYEASEHLGGLNRSAIAPHKMASELPRLEAEWLLAGGVEVVKGVRIGRDLSFAQLEAKHDAVFIGVGQGGDLIPDLPGVSAVPVLGAIELIEGLKGTCPSAIAEQARRVRSVAVVGGGNTAVDAARALRAAGVPEVTIVYRREEALMPAFEHEWQEARREGVRFRFLSAPEKILAVEGRVTGLGCVTTRLGAPDETGRRAPNPIPGSEHELPCEAVVFAVGRVGVRALLPDLPADIVVKGGRVVADPSTGATARPGWWAGGDSTSGGREVVTAAVAGLKAAQAIHRALSARDAAPGVVQGAGRGGTERG